jgi:hypothetical protein
MSASAIWHYVTGLATGERPFPWSSGKKTKKNQEKLLRVCKLSFTVLPTPQTKLLSRQLPKQNESKRAARFHAGKNYRLLHPPYGSP